MPEDKDMVAVGLLNKEASTASRAAEEINGEVISNHGSSIPHPKLTGEETSSDDPLNERML